MSRWTRVASTAVIALLAACTDTPQTAPDLRPSETGPASIISDAAHGNGKSHFYFLPPMVPKLRLSSGSFHGYPAASAPFDADLSPKVEICELTAGECSRILATYTTTEGHWAQKVRIIGADWPASLDLFKHYSVLWFTRGHRLNPRTMYRIRVLVDDIQLGYADVDVVRSFHEFRKVNRNEYVALLDDWILPITFRVEQGFLARMQVEPAEATVGVGEAQQFTANVTDLHGATLPNVPISWSNGNSAVATLSENGLATAIGAGQTTITARAEWLQATATLNVDAPDAPGNNATLATGTFHSCAIATSGATHCWGFNNNGQLGNGVTGNSSVPVLVTGGHEFLSVVAGSMHTCGLKEDGSAWCWGQGQFGALGDDLGENTWEPVPVFGGLTFSALTAGGNHTCGITLEGAAYCWGRNNQGQLGAGTISSTEPAWSPVAVVGGNTFQKLDAGSTHTCGLTTAGAALCWGSNFNGELGTGVAGTAIASPQTVTGAFVFKAIIASQTFSCAVDLAGAAHCWGSNSLGALGINQPNGTHPSPQLVAGGLTFADLSTALTFHTCGRTTTGAAYCWGNNASIQLGTGAGSSTAPSLVPVAVVGGDSWAILAGGQDHSCGITNIGTAKCWGSGTLGQLGHGEFTSKPEPTAVPGIVFERP